MILCHFFETKKKLIDLEILVMEKTFLIQSRYYIYIDLTAKANIEWPHLAKVEVWLMGLSESYLSGVISVQAVS